MELLDFEEWEKYQSDLKTWNRREERNNETRVRNKKIADYENYKKKKFGKKPIG